MNQIEKIPLFSIDLLKIPATNHDKIKKHIMDLVYPHYVKNGPNDPIQNTYTDYGMTHDAAFCHWPYLYKLYDQDIRSCIEACGFDLKKHSWQIKMKGWYNLTNQNTKEFIHDHMGGPKTIQFSAVHYVSLENKSWPTAFKNPMQKLIKATIPTKNMDYLPSYFYNFDRMPEATEGDIVFFPSWIDHYVPAHTNGTLRITNALNIMMRADDADGN